MTSNDIPRGRPEALPATIRAYQPSDRQAVVELNLDWIEEFFSVEDTDRKQLEGLETTILSRGGRIVVAELDGRVVGTGAIVPPHHQPNDGRKWLEIIKMATEKEHRRKGIGGAVLKRLKIEARAMGADAIWLETNSVLESGVRLYASLGFRHLDPDDWWPTPYARCNVQMALDL